MCGGVQTGAGGVGGRSSGEAGGHECGSGWMGMGWMQSLAWGGWRVAGGVGGSSWGESAPRLRSIPPFFAFKQCVRTQLFT